MALWLERMGIFSRAPDARPLSQIEAEIDEELAFHVDEATRAGVESGRRLEVARAEALASFGDVDRIRRECARTQMGEKIMLQRLQLGTTVLLLAGVAWLAVTNYTMRAAMAEERDRSMHLLQRMQSRLEESLAASSAPNWLPVPAPTTEQPHGGTAPFGAPTHVAADGRVQDFASAVESWRREFDSRRASWRLGLKVAERLSVLPDAQGVEILGALYSVLPTSVREQVAKPFVFDGGHPHALEVLALGMADSETSVRERAALYLETYAWKNLLHGDGAAESWFVEWRDRPVAEVLRANAERWAREVGQLAASYDMLPESPSDWLFSVVDHVALATYEKNEIDLGALLRAHGVDRLGEARLGQLSAESAARVRTVLEWCRTR